MRDRLGDRTKMELRILVANAPGRDYGAFGRSCWVLSLSTSR